MNNLKISELHVFESYRVLHYGPTAHNGVTSRGHLFLDVT